MSDENAPGALAGLKAIDLSRVLAGRSAPRSSPTTGRRNQGRAAAGRRDARLGPPSRTAPPRYFIGVNRNKRGIALDLTGAAGRAVLFRLLADADVMIENFKTGTWRNGGWATTAVLKECFPRLIHCRITGSAPTGRWAAMPATMPRCRPRAAS